MNPKSIDLKAYLPTRKALAKEAEADSPDLENMNALFTSLPDDLRREKVNYFLAPVLELALEKTNLALLDWVLSKGLKKGSLLNPPGYQAVKSQKLEILERLIQAGVDLNTLSLGCSDEPDGKHALLAAICSMQLDMLKALTEAGIDVNFVSRNDRSPLELAEALEQHEMVSLLKKAGATGLKDDQLSLKEAIRRKKWARVHELIPKTEESALHIALEAFFESDQIQALKDITAVLDEQGLVYGLGQAAKLGKLELVKDYLDKGAQVNALPGKANQYWPDGWGDTALVLASERNQIDVVTCLLQAGANPNFTDKRKDTALHAAAKRNHVEIATLLLKAGADHKIKNDQKETPMSKAKAYWGKDIIPLLKKAGAKPRTPTGIARSAKKKLKPFVKKAYLPKVKSQTSAAELSHYGGLPYLIGDWPQCGLCHKNMPLFIQLNLAEMPEPVGTGLAQLFYCLHCQTYDPQKYQACLTRIIPETGGQQASSPAETQVFTHKAILDWSTGKDDFPWRDNSVWEQADLDAEEEEKAAFYNLTGDKALGWPHWLQDALTPKDSQGNSMQFLYQLDQGHLDYVWGDSGIGYLFISSDHQELAFLCQSL